MAFWTCFLESDHVPLQTLYRGSAEEKQAADREVAMQQMRKVIQSGRIDAGPWGPNAAVLPSISFLSYAGS
jgi:hypothetical protein